MMFGNMIPTWLVAFLIFCAFAVPIAALILAIKGIIWLCQHVRFV